MTVQFRQVNQVEKSKCHTCGDPIEVIMFQATGTGRVFKSVVGGASILRECQVFQEGDPTATPSRAQAEQLACQKCLAKIIPESDYAWAWLGKQKLLRAQ